MRDVGISQLHGDHIGQSARSEINVLIGKGDWDVVTKPGSRTRREPRAVRPNGSKQGKSSLYRSTREGFGDGTVIM